MKDDKELTNLWISIELAKIKFTGTHDIHTTHDKKCGILPLGCIGKLTIFNPFDNATNLELRDEYRVTLDYVTKSVYILKFPGGKIYSVEFADASEINRAVLLCVLESVK